MTDRDLIIACLLNPELVRERVDEWRRLTEQATEQRTVPAGIQLLLPNPDLAPAVAELVRAEHECCPFFDFTIRLDHRGLTLEVTAPPEARLLVDELLGVGQALH